MARVIVVYGGGFQPFHAGHLSSYLEAKQAFPNADFYVVASADVKQRPIPFEDKRFLATQAGVNPKDFRDVAVKNPLNPTEILSNYDPEQDIYILVRSERDPVPYTRKDGSPAYYQPFVKGGKFQPFGKHGYVFVTKKKDFKLLGQDVYSGTQVRNMYSQANDQQRQEMVREMYPRSKQQNTIKKMLDKYIGKPAMSESVIYLIKQARPLLKEANNEQKLRMLKLIKEAISETKKLTTAEKLNRNLKRGGFDSDASLQRIKDIEAKYKKPDQPKEPEKKEQLEEGIVDYITKKIDDFLDYPKISSREISRIMKQAPKQLPDDVAEQLVAKFMESAKAQRLAQEAAEAKRTTPEKIMSYLTYFASEFVDRWKKIPERDRENALRNLVYNIGRFLLFILDVLAKGGAKKESVEETKSKAIAHAAKDLTNPDAGRLAKIQHNKELRRDEIERRSHEARANRKYSSTRDSQNKVKDGVEIRESQDYLDEK